jgi:hypothetical protein
MTLSRLSVAAFALGLAALVARTEAATTTTVVDVPTRGVTQRFLYVRPDAPVANIVFLPGRDGRTGIENDGSIPTIIGRCGLFSRNSDSFASRGFAIAIVDQASDGKVRQFADLYEIARYMRERDNVPTWIVGGSGSTTAALNFAAEFPIDEPLGVIIFSPFSRSHFAEAAGVKRPTLVIHHRDEGVTPPYLSPAKRNVESLFDALTAAPVKERIGLVGGIVMDECGGYHLFRGIDEEFVDATAGFVDRNNSFPRAREPR